MGVCHHPVGISKNTVEMNYSDPPPPSFGQTPFSDLESKEIASLLNEPCYGDRVAEANRLFGCNGWSQKVKSVDVRFVEERSDEGWFACVSAVVRITLKDGCSREDRGGAVCERAVSRGQALLRAEQDAIEDAVKRALKNFGPRLGLGKH